MEHKDVFQKLLKTFEKVLNQFGYTRGWERDESDTTFFPIRTRICFLNSSLKLNIEICYSRIQTQKANSETISFDMHKHLKPSLHFSLRHHIGNLGLQALINDTYPKNTDFEAFVAKYFIDLEKAFNTFLKDQITGVKFEDHSDQIMDEVFG